MAIIKTIFTPTDSPVIQRLRVLDEKRAARVIAKYKAKNKKRTICPAQKS